MGVGRGLRVEVEVPGDERTSTPAIFKGPRAVSHPTCCCSASLDRCDRCDLLVGLEGDERGLHPRYSDARHRVQ